MLFTPTKEQADITGAFRKFPKEGILITAGAGSGKTSTMLALAFEMESMTHPVTGKDLRAAYLAFNKAIATEAKAKFPANTYCSTVHSMAYQACGKAYHKRLSGGRRGRKVVGPTWASARRAAVILGIHQAIKCGERILQPAALANLAQAAVGKFCTSAATEIQSHHVPVPDGIDPEYHEPLRSAVLPWAVKAWQEIQVPDESLKILGAEDALKFKHNYYLKIWQLRRPDLTRDYDVLFYDEAQDANPCTLEVVMNFRDAGGLVVAVGDENQAINGWNGAINSMTAQYYPGARDYRLTKSFRFGQPIAEEANKWLTLLGSDMRITGHDPVKSEVGFFPHKPDAVLCRTNAGAIAEVITLLECDYKVAMVGESAKELTDLAWAAYNIKAGKGTDHPELCAFTTWAEVEEYADEPAGSDLRVFVTLVKMHGTRALIDTLKRLVKEDQADVTVSTAHRAKGREWDSVRISSDFRRPVDKETGEPGEITDEFMMLAYVATTRARKFLDRGGLALIDDYDLDEIDDMSDDS